MTNTDRKKRAAEYIKEAYNTIRNGTVANISQTKDDDDGSITELLITADDKQVKLQIGRGSMQRWR